MVGMGFFPEFEYFLEEIHSVRTDSNAPHPQPQGQTRPDSFDFGRDRGKPLRKVRAQSPPDTKHTMKTTILSATIAIPLAFALASCGEKPAATEEAIEPTEESVATGAEKVAEGVKEMAEGAAEAADDAVEGAQDAAADAAAAAEKAAADAASAVEEAASDAAEAITEEPAPAE